MCRLSLHAVVLGVVLFSSLITPLWTCSQEEAILQLSNAFRRAIEKVRPAVVSIGAERDSITVEQQWKELEEQHKGLPESFRKFLPDIEPYKDQLIPKRGWQGSGVIVSASGEVLTNNHVVLEADSLRITLDDGREMQAKIIASDPDTDLALIQLEGEAPFPFAHMGDSNRVQVGDWVLAIGNPFGLSQSVSEGIVSAKGRTTAEVPVGTVLGDYIQTTAAINPGNSGGPLVNLDGEVIGINNSIQTAGVPANLGIGFAIPSEIAEQFIDNLHQYGAVKRGAIGISLEIDPAAIQEYYEKYNINHGALVSQVLPGFPAETAGILPGDMILEINGKKVKDGGNMIYLVSMLPIDSEVKLRILREGAEKEIALILTDRSKVIEVAEAEQESRLKAEETIPDTTGFADLGIQIETLTPELAKEKGYTKDLQGVLITGVESGGVGARFDLREGDVIAELENHPIRAREDFEKAMKEIREAMAAKKMPERAVMLYVYRAGSRFHPKYVAPTLGAI